MAGYGACRLCLVEVEGRGVVGSCSMPPEAGMVVRTNTPQIREIRKIAVELLLANHEQACPTCVKSNSCQLQAIARRLGVNEVRFKSVRRKKPIDRSTPSLVRDPNKCILCGDCVRMCHEVQGVGAIDFARRGASVDVLPAFGKNLDSVACVYCGQCARVCPTGALTPAVHTEGVWAALHDKRKTVVAQIAPAVRVAIGEHFGLEPGRVMTGQVVAALKAIGFDHVYDTSFTADMTVIEEATEFLNRLGQGKQLPQFTSCCPAWVRFVELHYPNLLGNLSSCRSPQQMFGSLAKEVLPKTLGVAREDLVVVSIMPCTAKKYEATREEFSRDGVADVDHVLTTQELGAMIEEAGLDFQNLSPESLDMPFGFKTGAGVIFGNTGGVSEAVLRFAHEKVTGKKIDAVDFLAVRGQEGIRMATVNMGGKDVRIAVAHGLANARKLAQMASDGEIEFDLAEVMACPGGCIGGAGQPNTRGDNVRAKRTQALYDTDKTLQLHKSQDNPMVSECYEKHLGQVGGHKAHELLHTSYHSRRRIFGEHIVLHEGAMDNRIEVAICVGTNCHVKGSHDLLRRTIDWIAKEKLSDAVDVKATFCCEACKEAPNVVVDGKVIGACTMDKIKSAIMTAAGSRAQK
ncbi:MAG: 4Fe-4S binding protein, partial [Planctomycetes bacterium]|nr:4Fe-4S binding protein [Planctomycetota bacterium]